jgi:hypothetical protein
MTFKGHGRNAMERCCKCKKMSLCDAHSLLKNSLGVRRGQSPLASSENLGFLNG